MPRLAANLTLLYNELPILQRFEVAKRAGFRGAEILFPYDISVTDLQAAARASKMDIVLMNCPAPNWAGGPRGFAAVPELRARFRADFERALRISEALSTRHIRIMAGRAKGDAARACFVDNLRWAARRAPHASLTIKPMSSAEAPGYFLSDFETAVEVIDAVGEPNLGLQFDLCQVHQITGDVMACWKRHGPHVRHVQIAGIKNWHEPSKHDLDFEAFYAALQASHYPGWISAAYTPRSTTEAGLGWLPTHARLIRDSQRGNLILPGMQPGSNIRHASAR